MTESRTERTDFLGLLALYNVDGKIQGWGWPYWGQLQIDAALAALHDAPRTGASPLTAPDAPTLNALATGGYLLSSTTYEVAQTFVDGYGRETDASTVASVITDAAIANPAAAASLAAANASAGFAGGLFEVRYSWVDAALRETAASPVATLDLPYLASPLYSEVTVTLPATPASVGAAGANIYIRHRSGNTVLAAMITIDTETESVLNGVISNCSLTAPTVNNTGATAAIEITGAAANSGETPTLTRFYVRQSGQEWTLADRRLKLSSVDEWDPDTVSYPLTFTGLSAELAPGYPPTISQVKSVRPVDLATETTGVLPSANLDAALARDAEVVTLLGGPYVLTGLLVEAQAAPDMTVKSSTGWAVSDERIWNPALDASIAIAAAHATLDRIDIVCVNASGAIVSSSEDALCKGTADAAPVAPSTPAHYVLLATISVPATDTTIGAAQITDSRTLMSSLATHEAASTLHFTGTEKADDLLSSTQKTDLTDGGATTLHTHPGVGTDFWAEMRNLQGAITSVESRADLQAAYEAAHAIVDSFETAYWSADGIITGLVASTAGSLNMPYTTGDALVNGLEYLAIAASSIALTASQTNYVYVNAAGVVAAQTGGWPAGRHAKICTAVCSASAVTSVDNTVKLAQDAYDAVNNRLAGSTQIAAACDVDGKDPAAQFAYGISSGGTAMFANDLTGHGQCDYTVTTSLKRDAGASNITIAIYADNADKPAYGAGALATMSTDLGGTSAVDFATTFANLNLTDGSKYWVVYSATGTFYVYEGLPSVGNFQTSNDGGTTWNVSANRAHYFKVDYVAASTRTWFSRVLTDLDTIVGLYRAVRKAANSGAWDSAVYGVTVEARVEAEGSWQAMPEGSVLEPSGATRTQLELRVTLSGKHASTYPLVNGFAAVWKV